MHRYHDSSFFARQTIITIGCSRLLRATFLETFQSQIFASNAAHRGVMNTSFSGNLACWSMRLWRVFLTRDQIINTVSTLSSIRTVRGRPLPFLLAVVPVFRSFFFSNLFSELKTQPLSGNSLMFFRTVTFLTDFQSEFDRRQWNPITHVYVKASSATQATRASAPRLKIETTTSPWHQQISAMQVQCNLMKKLW